MLDFKRIGGEIVSSPLNENFRRMRNDISIANTNLFFPETNGVVDTISDMYGIQNPEDAQCCYVISSGELYRYSKHDDDWHKIADFGNTFRQGFLNSGAVVLEDYVRLKDNTTTTLLMPKMLVYFKNQPGDDRYLKGMYLIDAKELDISASLHGGNSYSIVLDTLGKYNVITGMPTVDDPNNIFIGTVLVNGDNEIIPSFVYTIPDMAYTADRGHFYLEGGQVEGLNLVGNDQHDATVNRKAGLYYDEGVNFVIGTTDNYPIDNDNGSNYNLKSYESRSPVSALYYVIPEDGLNKIITNSSTIIYDKYYDKVTHQLKTTQKGTYTIQQHLVTPNGQNIIIYGTDFYNSYEDAKSNLNTTYGLQVNFPYVEATRIIVKHVNDNETFDSGNVNHCDFYTLGRLSQVGTISPKFADDIFEIYSGKATDITPAAIKFDLDKLENENYNNKYNLVIAPFNTTRDLFSLDKKYITDTMISDMTKTQSATRTEIGEGYQLADNKDLDFLKTRVSDIEKELWSVKQTGEEQYNQSVRYRLFGLETNDAVQDVTLADHEDRITHNEQNKVNKGTKINGYTLGDNTNKEELKTINLVTGDINEGVGKGTKTNLWYTEERVSANTDVVASKNHRNTKSANDNATGHSIINPHNLSTDDLKLLNGTQKIFVTPAEEARIRSDKLPENTKQALADLDAKNLDSISIKKIQGNSDHPSGVITSVGNITGMKLYDDGLNISMDTDNKTLILETTERSNSMGKDVYATASVSNPEALAGYVDKAIYANEAYHINGIEAAGNDKYYGTDNQGIAGIYDLPRYVSTEESGESINIDQVILVPQNNSISENHLVPDLRNKINNNYHTIYDTGVLKSNEINEINFGNNLSVSVTGHKATINATGTGSGTGATNFADLSDVNVTYTGNQGKMLIINNTEDGIITTDAPALEHFMLKAVYVDPVHNDKIKKAINADVATRALSADNSAKVGNKSVDDTKTDTNSLWTANKIISNTSTQISNEGIKAHSGTTVPADSLGKNGDIYILIN